MAIFKCLFEARPFISTIVNTFSHSCVILTNKISNKNSVMLLKQVYYVYLTYCSSIAFNMPQFMRTMEESTQLKSLAKCSLEATSCYCLITGLAQVSLFEGNTPTSQVFQLNQTSKSCGPPQFDLLQNIKMLASWYTLHLTYRFPSI